VCYSIQIKGHFFEVVSISDPPYLEKMIPIGNGIFKMEGGIFAEVFNALQVNS
jgi:hypothetical protein